MRRLAVVLVAAAATLVVAAPPARAGSAGYCPDARGVTVVVDYGALGGGTVVRCAPGDQPTGLAALENAGFTVTGTVRWGKGFVCRIDGKPGVDAEPCVDTPPASAYWSYWHAPNGGSWTYSSLGVRNRKPPAGSFEGWSFATGSSASAARPPGVAPKRPETAKPAPSRSSARPQPPRPAGERSTGPAVATPPAAPRTTGPTSAPPPTRPPAAAPVPSTTAAATAGGTPSMVDVAAPSAPGGGTPWPALLGLGLAAALGGAALLTARRRRADPGTG